MIDVSDAFKEAWLNGKQKHIQLAFSDGTAIMDDDIVAESFSLTQALCDEPQLVFGLTSSAEFRIQIFNTGKQFKGLYVTPTLYVNVDETQYSLAIGSYLIDEDTRSDDRLYRTLTGHDALYDVLNEDYSAWYKTLSAMTIKEFRDAFFTHVGITQEFEVLANDNLTINIKPEVSSLSGAEIIKCICEPNACFGFINYAGHFQYVQPSVGGRHFPADDLYPSNDLYPGDGANIIMDMSDVESAPVMGGLVYSDYYTHKITQAKFVYSENTPEVIGGVAGNCYQFEDNILMYGQSASALSTIVTNFLRATDGFFYTPSRVKGRARIWAELGDMLGVDGGYDSVRFPILRRYMSGITGLYDEYSAQGTEFYTYSANSVYQRLTDVETGVAENSDDIDAINEEIDGADGIKASIQTNADNIALEVRRAELAESAINISIDNIDLSVSKKVDKNGGTDTVVSQMNISPETIRLSTGRLIIDSGNFQLDASGYATAKGITLEDGIYISDGSNLYFDNNPFISLIAYGTYGQFGVTCNGEWSLPSGTTVGGHDVLTTNSKVSTAKRIDAEDGSKVFSKYSDLQLNASDSVVINTSSGDQTSPGTKGFHCFKRPFFEGVRTSDKTINGRIGGDDNELVKVTGSSMRWKNSITDDITVDYLDPHRLYDLKVKQFKFNTDYLGIEDRHYNKEVIGFIAEEVDSVYPIACDYDSFNMPENWNVRYMIPPMLKLIQEQHEKIQELEERILVLEGGN